MPKKAPEKIGSVLRVPLSQLHPHPQNPFAVRDDSSMQELKESVSQNGVLVPAIARPRTEGGYELIAGHRRKYACEQAGQDSMPVIVLNLNDDEAVIQLVDSNIQREDILPSERARAYKMKMDAIKRQGARTDLTSPNISAKFRSDDSVGEKDGISGDTVRNYISLNNLTPPLMRMVDEKKIALTPAYQLAALSTQEQELLVETMNSEQATPSLSQAQRMRKLSQSGELNEDTMSHTISLGADIFGNITRMDNLVDGLAKELAGYQSELQDSRTQLANAKAEMETPFAKEAELAEKSARLKELNILLNMDQKDKTLMDEAPEEGTPEHPRPRDPER